MTNVVNHNSFCYLSMFYRDIFYLSIMRRISTLKMRPLQQSLILSPPP
ncbi:protein of unknown function [Xenorhabdus poinarii G6]|uniref:Uncharacterized protein n=1 Tax=Xenorhabdus poinarii G6 TaxID=1354304 RepID=A0A068R424_9GAMM|nr:protein of unknown function [Xenorhabdus poinarii G6]